MEYGTFLASKIQDNNSHGFEASYLPDWLFGFQRSLVEWAARAGRSAIFADCGLGKTPMQLVWAENVVRHTNKPVLILTPLAVSYQTCTEAEKFEIEAKRATSGDDTTSTIVVTNYEKLHHFDPDDFAGVVCDESSILKNFQGKTKQAITEFARRLPYRLLCTATAAPNDFFELGTSSEALGMLGYTDMLTRFFKEETKKEYLGWGRKTYHFRGHAEQPFWRWVCSWARACRRPSDLGFDDEGFQLPELIETEHSISANKARDGMLFAMPAKTLQEQRQDRRNTIRERCEAAAKLCDGKTSVIWCHLNDEGKALASMVDGCEVSGAMSTEEKEDRLLSFQRGEINTLVTKPKIGCFGLNWQHCNNIVSFTSHSFEQYYQAVRRCWRFGQTKPVTVTTVTTEGDEGILANLRRKAAQADRMFSSLVDHMNDVLNIEDSWQFEHKERVPSWL